MHSSSERERERHRESEKQREETEKERDRREIQRGKAGETLCGERYRLPERKGDKRQTDRETDRQTQTDGRRGRGGGQSRTHVVRVDGEDGEGDVADAGGVQHVLHVAVGAEHRAVLVSRHRHVDKGPRALGAHLRVDLGLHLQLKPCRMGCTAVSQRGVSVT